MSYVSILSYASQPKGLPIVQNFTVPTDSTSQALLVSGSAWSGSANDTLQIQVLVGATPFPGAAPQAEEGRLWA